MSNPLPKIHCFITNDINQDQRMHRICTTLASADCDVTLTGRVKPDSLQLLTLPFKQQRIRCVFNNGIMFYLEYNLRIFFQLLFKAPDVIYSVDTDTLLACTVARIIRRKKLIFDAHEYFTEVPELSKHPVKKTIWKLVEKLCIPHADKAITVNNSLGKIFTSTYKKKFVPIFNVPIGEKVPQKSSKDKNIILYQGVLNQGRGLEVLIDAMQWIPDLRLVIAGEGDLSEQLRALAAKSPCSSRITFTGWLSPSELTTLTQQAYLGVNLLDSSSLNYYYSLANKFFDYMHAGIPSLNMDFPEYRHWIEKYDVGYLTKDLTPQSISHSINEILSDQATYNLKRLHCFMTAQTCNWENESVKIKNILKDLL